MAFIAFLGHACLHLFTSMELVKSNMKWGAPMWLFGNLCSITLVGLCLTFVPFNAMEDLNHI